MNSKNFPLVELVNWLLKKYHDLQKELQLQNAYRIIDIKHKRGQRIIVAQVINKAQVFECTPQEIVANDYLLEGFSKKDIRTITYFATQDLQKPHYTILQQEFCDEDKKIIFKLHNYNHSTNLVEKTADQISLDKTLLNNLSQEDAHLIGFTAAREMAIEEKKEIENLLKNNT